MELTPRNVAADAVRATPAGSPDAASDAAEATPAAPGATRRTTAKAADGRGRAAGPRADAAARDAAATPPNGGSADAPAASRRPTTARRAGPRGSAAVRCSPAARRAAGAAAVRAAVPADPPAESAAAAGAPAAVPADAVSADAAAQAPLAASGAAAGTQPPRRPVARDAARPRIGRIPVLDVQPCVEHGAWPAKAVPGEFFTVRATVFREGHDAVACEVVLTGPDGGRRAPVRMQPWNDGSDRWSAEVAADAEGRWTYAVQAWADPLATWHHRAEVKVPAGLDVELELTEGGLLFERAALGVPDGDGRAKVEAVAEALRDAGRSPADRLAAAFAGDVLGILRDFPLRELVTSSAPLPLEVERERALVGSWYEFFPRSEGAVVDPTGQHPPRSGTFRTAMARLDGVAAMGFDVVYLPPIHPIGRAFRKGPNNALQAGEHDPGSPWAIGGAEGGHDAIHPELGTFEDFDAFVARARELGMEVALDFALQASPDHPWVHQHPEWFAHRADGTIAYAENPPKRYQDIYPIAFDADFDGFLAECLRILRLWMSHGVRIFRVDNPHTKPVVFWERLIAEIRAGDPDVVFLAEAFTGPAMMHTLAKVGFQQSYTYFTWRNSKDEVESYARELSGEAAAYFRPNLFVNTPDILHAYLQHGGPAAFRVRATLAALLSPSWGVYSGFELYESTPARPGSEEYLDSEKYQLRPRDFEAAARESRTLAPYLALLNRVRRDHPALRRLRNLRFHHADNDGILVFSKHLTHAQIAGAQAPGDGGHDGDDTVVVVVNLDPHTVREATVRLDLPELGLGRHEGLTVHDEITGATFRWGEYNYVRLDPAYEVAHILTVRRSVP